MRSLCIISDGYPCNTNKILYPFLRQLAHAIARQEVKVTVIAPIALHRALRRLDPLHSCESVVDGTHIDVFHPVYISASDRQVWIWNTAQIGFESFCAAVRRILKRHVLPQPDALYGHFLYPGGASAVRLGRRMGIPSFPMAAEGLLNTVDAFGLDRARGHFAGVTAFMANSSCLAGQLQKDLGVDKARIGVFPNGIDHRIFFPRDKAAMRLKLGLSMDDFLVICVAKQDLQKGPARVGEAIRGMEGVKGIFLGAGPNPPVSDNIIFNQSVSHEQVPEYLSAADVFVLPSTFEGSCNAALEAMACGLPVVSSTGSFNDDILSAEVSIRVDPFDVTAIRSAIVELRDNPSKREAMGSSALVWAEKFDIDLRARRILAFMEAERRRAEFFENGNRTTELKCSM